MAEKSKNQNNNLERTTKIPKESFFVSTPIYYPNDVPHIGHAYTSIAADIIARWNRLQGKDVLFTTGTDDHGKKIKDTAIKAGKTPKEFTDQLIPEFKSAWKSLNISYDRFIRTTDPDHEAVVQSVLQKCLDNGDIYKGEYVGLYCTGCEAYFTEKDLSDGCCPIHKKPIEKVKEETYFFRLSKYQDKLLELYKSTPFLVPKHRSQEIINRVEEGLHDLSISRASLDWGVPLPFDSSHVAYVWFDALFNYYSATRESGKENFWPADLHIVGKDINWFHTVYWPAFLMSAGIDLPKQVFAHGWWTLDSEKISKSRGKVISIDELIGFAGLDSARYFLFRQASFGEDGDFSSEALIERHNNELANKLGNLVSRTSSLAEKYGIEESENELIKSLNKSEIEKHFEEYRIDKALSEIFTFIDNCNEFIQFKKPWETKSKTDLYQLVESIREIAKYLSPFIPETAEKIQEVFKSDQIKKAPVLFQKIMLPTSTHKSPQQAKEQSQATSDRKINNEEIQNKSMENVKTLNNTNAKQQAHKPTSETSNEVSFNDFAKLDLRVAKITNVEEIKGADKLWKLSLDVGELGGRTICAGIKEFYSAEELQNKTIIIIANLAPRKLRGIESQGMLLAASSKDRKTVSLLSPDKDMSPGSTVG